MKGSLKIFVFGGARAMTAYVNLRRRHKSVRYFRSKSECDFKRESPPDVVIIDEDISSYDQLKSLRALRQYGDFHIIYLSRNKRFTNIVKAFNLGATDYIIKDSYLYFTINNSLDQLLELKMCSSGFVSNEKAREISSIKLLYPRCFKMYQWFVSFKVRLTFRS